MVQSGFIDICEIAGQQLRIQYGARCNLAGKAIAGGAVGVSILIDRELSIPKQLEKKRRIDAAVAVEVAVMVEHSLPRDHCREMRRLQRRHLPLLDCEIRDAEKADLAVRP